jgi:Coenzyme PQQ synthesis protein D (PqqD)
MRKITNKISLDSRLKRAPDVISTDLNGEEVILNLSTGTYFGLDPVGARVWQLLKKGMTLREVFRVMIGEYDVEENRLQADLLGIAGDLNENGLVEDA